MAETMTIAELEPGDEIRWPDGQGGHLWPTVLRNLIVPHEDGTEQSRILLGGIAAHLEDSPACQGKLLVGVEKDYPGDLELTVRRPVT